MIYDYTDICIYYSFLFLFGYHFVLRYIPFLVDSSFINRAGHRQNNAKDVNSIIPASIYLQLAIRSPVSVMTGLQKNL